MRRPVAIAVLSLALLGLTGCKSACRQLSERLCDCNTNSVERELCVQRAANDETAIEPTSSQEDTCDGLLNAKDEQGNYKCNCGDYQTDEGKMACGLAR
jgi:hypothetical protein